MKEIDIINKVLDNLSIPTSTWKYIDHRFLLVNYNKEMEIITNNKIDQYLGQTSDKIYNQDICDYMVQCHDNKTDIKKDYIKDHKSIRTTYIYINEEYIVVQSEDISIQQDSIREINKEKETKEVLLKTIINSTPDLIFAKDKEFKFIFVNKVFASIFNSEPEDFIGKTDVEVGFSHEMVFGGMDNKDLGFRSEDQKVLDGLTIHNEYDPVSMSENDMHIFDTLKVPLKDVNGNIYGILGFARDITDLYNKTNEIIKINENLNTIVDLRTKEINEQNIELQKLNEDYIHQNNELQQFAHIASHDLQEPLRTIKGFITLLQMRYNDIFDENATKYMNFVLDSSNRMQLLIDDILKYSKLEHNSIDMEDVDLNLLIPEIYDDLKELVQDGKLSLIYEKLPIIRSNKQMMYSLFSNLIVNSIKYRSDELPIIEINFYSCRDDYIKFSVKDNGIGIEKEYQGKVFDSFYRLHSKSDYDGTGIGLSLCKKIVKNHGGNIWVDSVVDIGSTFFFTIKTK